MEFLGEAVQNESKESLLAVLSWLIVLVVEFFFPLPFLLSLSFDKEGIIYETTRQILKS